MARARNGNRPLTGLRRSFPGRVIALLLIVVLATGLFFLGIEDQVRDEQESVIALQSLRAEIATAQSSVRGYTLVGRPRFLEPYRQALPAIDTSLDDVNSAMSDDNRERIDSVASLFGQWRRRFAEPTIAHVRNDRREDAEALARTGSGKRRIDRIRALLAAEVAEEQEEGKESERVEAFLGAVAIVAIIALSLAVGLAWRPGGASDSAARDPARLTFVLASNPASFRKVGNRVELRGKVAGGPDIQVFTLPEGYRPRTERQFHVASGSGTSVVTISPAGAVLADPTAGWVSFDGISFEID